MMKGSCAFCAGRFAYEGYPVDTALDGETGLHLARDHHPDLVILDLMLPGMDGIEVCQRCERGEPRS